MSTKGWLRLGDVIGGALMLPMFGVGFVIGSLIHGFRAGWIASRTMLVQRARTWERN